jgi:hypothetical protein
VAYNLEVMRYALYCGEPIFVGYFRLPPGPTFWIIFYLCIDFFGIWPYLAANAAVPLHAAILGHLPAQVPTEYLSVEEVAARTGLPREVVLDLKERPGAYGKETEGKKPYPAPVAAWMQGEKESTQRIAYVVFLASFIPLIFGGKIYNSLEKLMVAKMILVLGYLVFLGVFFVSPATWGEIFAGFLFLGKGTDGSWGFRLFPETTSAATVDWALLAGFAAIAGQGGLTNMQFSNYARDKGWGMGAQVGAIPSMVGGMGITLSHTGKVFRLTEAAVARWRGWMRLLLRDQIAIWTVGCILGVAIPAIASLEFVRGTNVSGDAVAAATAQGISRRTGIQAFWFLTLLCGFIVLLPSQLSQADGIIRRWTDVLWTGSRRLRGLEGHKVKYVYYGLLVAYALWGLFVLVGLADRPLQMVKVTAGVLMNYALGFSSFHSLAVNWRLLPRELQCGWFLRLALAGCGVFFTAIASLALHKLLHEAGWF